MKKVSFKSIGLSLIISLFPVFAVTALAETDFMGGKAVITGGADVAVQQRDVDGSVEKFNEYRNVRNGFIFNEIRLGVIGNESPYYLDLKIKNPLQDNEFYRLNLGKHGGYNLKFLFDRIPHNFSTRKLLFSGAGTGRLLIADQIQTDLQGVEQTRQERGGNPLSDTTGEDTIARGIVNSLYVATDTTAFKLKRDKTGFVLDFNITDNTKAWAKVTNEKRSGTRVTSAGSYERYAQGASGLAHTGDMFFISGAELAEPIDYRTTTFSIGAGVYKKKWLADLEYTLTNFDNEYLSLRWDNPFRISDASATSSTGGAGDPFNRGRFATGQLSLMPDSKSHDFSVSAAVELPLRSRFSANISYGWIIQEEPFVPYTMNSAISSVAGFDVTNTANLPKGDLGGDVRTLAQNYVLTSKPIEPLRLTAKYRYYNYDNNSDQIHFPGYAAFGESYWRTMKNDKKAPVENEPLSYTRQNIDLSADYHIIKPLTLLLEGGWEIWDREKLRIDSTKESNIGGGLIYKLSKIASLKGGYKYAHRTVDGYKTGNTASNPEAVGLVNYDWAERNRDKADLRFQVSPVNSVSLGLSGQYLNDKYAEDERFGLKRSKAITGNFDVAYAPSNVVTVYANYGNEYRRSEIQSGAKDDTFNSAGTLDDAFTSDNFNPFNYWNTNIKEKTDTVGIGLTIQIVPDRLILDTNYNFSHSKMDFDNYNPNGKVKLANAEAQDWPNVVNRLHEFKIDLSYSVAKNLKAGLRYMYEKYDLDDFAWDDMKTYMAGLSSENSTRFLFTDATYNGYEAHVGGVYITYMF